MNMTLTEAAEAEFEQYCDDNLAAEQRCHVGRPNKLPWIDNGFAEDARKVFIGTDGNMCNGKLYHCTLVLPWIHPTSRVVVPIPRWIHHCPDDADGLE